MEYAERDKTLIEVRTVLVGIEGTDDKGIAGDIKEIKTQLLKINTRVTQNTTKIKILMAVVFGGSGIATLASKVQGLW